MAAAPLPGPSDVPGPRSPLPLADEGNPVCERSLNVDPLPRAEADRLSRMLKAIADPTRLQMLSMLLAAPDGEACVCDLTTPLTQTQPTVSYHLKVLADAGLVTRRRVGTWMWYAVQRERSSFLSSVVFTEI